MTEQPIRYSDELLTAMYEDINERHKQTKPTHSQKHPILVLALNASFVNALLFLFFIYYEQLHTLYMQQHGFAESLAQTSPYTGYAIFFFMVWLLFTGMILGWLATYYYFKRNH